MYPTANEKHLQIAKGHPLKAALRQSSSPPSVSDHARYTRQCSYHTKAGFLGENGHFCSLASEQRLWWALRNPPSSPNCRLLCPEAIRIR